MAKRGPKQRIDVSFIAIMALLVVRLHGAERKPAARAAILAYFTWGGDQHPQRRVEERLVAVLKALQRLEAGKTKPHPEIIRAAGIAYSSSPETPIFGTAPELAQAVATFLPK